MRPKSTLFYGLLVIAIGVLLIAFNNRGELLTWVVILAGIALIVPCLYTLVTTIGDERRLRRTGTNTSGMRFMSTGIVISSVLGIALGIWLVSAPNFFIRFIAYAFAVLLIVYGIYHLCVVLWMVSPAKLPIGYYVIPVILIILGVIILCTGLHSIKSAVIIITGFGLVGSGISSILEYFAVRKAIAAESVDKHIA